MFTDIILAFDTYRLAICMPRPFWWACRCVRGSLKYHLILQVSKRLNLDIWEEMSPRQSNEYGRGLWFFTSAAADFMTCIKFGRVGTVVWAVALSAPPGVTFARDMVGLSTAWCVWHVTSPSRRAARLRRLSSMRQVPVGKWHHLAVKLCKRGVWVGASVRVERLFQPPWDIVRNGFARESQNVSDCAIIWKRLATMLIRLGASSCGHVTNDILEFLSNLASGKW